MKFKKLALAAAVAALPATGFSMEAMEDSALSGVTGQDGISITLDPGASGLSLDVYVHDTDGIPAGTQAGHGFAGAIVIDDMSVTGRIQLDIDAGDSATGGTAPVLNVGVSMPDGLTLATGDISVANSNRDDGAWGIDTTNQTGTILQSTTISLGAGTSLNIQLGNEPQGNMIALASTITGGLTIGTSGDFNDNLSVTDAGGAVSGGVLGASAMTIVDNGGTDLTLDVGVDANADGLVIGLANQGALDIRMEDVFLGTADAAHTLGDVELVGLDLSSTSVTITGK